VQRVIDLDTVLSEDVIVRLEGKEYQLPGDVPVPMWLRISQAADAFRESLNDDSTGSDTLIDLYRAVLPLFQIYQPDLEEIPMSGRKLLALIFGLYDSDEDPVEAEPDPTVLPAEPAGKTTTTSPRKRKPRPQGTGSGSSSS
jgi:hypothetical protein